VSPTCWPLCLSSKVQFCSFLPVKHHSWQGGGGSVSDLPTIQELRDFGLYNGLYGGAIHPHQTGACGKVVCAFLAKGYIALQQALGFPHSEACQNQTISART